MIQRIESELLEAQEVLGEFLASGGSEQIHRAAQLLTACIQGGGKILTCGNGGSMCDAMHMAEELSGRYRADRPALPALALSDPGFLTCAANDFGFERVFMRGIEALGKPGDALVAFSTSGKSPNILAALATARELGLATLLLTGAHAPQGLADVEVRVPTRGHADRVQEVHIKAVHIMIREIEEALFS